MSVKQISDSKLFQLIRDSKCFDSIDTESPRYSHSYFTEPDEQFPLDLEYIIFTIKANHLPRKPVYIDISNLRDLISSMTGTLRNSETIKFKNELLDLLNKYEKIS